MSSDKESKDLINEENINTPNSEISGSTPSTNSSEKRTKEKNIGLKVTFIVVVAVVVTISFILLYFNTSTKRFYTTYNSGDITKSVEIYTKSSDMSKEEITGFLQDQSNELEKQYLNEVISYEDYLSSMEIIVAILPNNENISNSINLATSTKTDRTNLSSAKKLSDEKKYIESIDTLQNIKEDSVEYKNAQDLIAEASKALEKKVEYEISKYIINNQLLEAKDLNEKVQLYISSEAYTKNKENLEYQTKQAKLSLLNDQLTMLEKDKDILYSELYIDDEKGKYGLLAITNDKLPTNLDKDNQKYGLTPVLNNKISYYLADDDLTLQTLLETYAYMPIDGASGAPTIFILDYGNGNNTLLINNSYNYNAVSFNTYYGLSDSVETTSIYNDYTKSPSVHYFNDTVVPEHVGLSSKDSFLQYDKTQKLKIYWKTDNNKVLNHHYYPDDVSTANSNHARASFTELLDK